MTDEEKVNRFIAKGDATGLKQWELGLDRKLDDALLERIDTFLKSQGRWYGNNAAKRGE